MASEHGFIRTLPEVFRERIHTTHGQGRRSARACAGGRGGEGHTSNRLQEKRSSFEMQRSFFVEGVGFNCNGDVIGFIDTPQVSPDDSYQRKPIKAMKST